MINQAQGAVPEFISQEVAVALALDAAIYYALNF